ncbi:hypothetical protein EPI10_022998 [Gossypium australe]|uniref:Uncharacterized protein n=1 Tax=Gossypium australe TaxID=47621 RepID=A0A5B6VTT9_9ROSI|nr:hypothetical protein EPI10_022998 [Gossypium australe]
MALKLDMNKTHDRVYDGVNGFCAILGGFHYEVSYFGLLFDQLKWGQRITEGLSPLMRSTLRRGEIKGAKASKRGP